MAWTCPAATPGEGLLYAVARDITEQKKLQEQLVQLATYDSLTGLANRALFLREASRAIARCQRTNIPMVVLYIDLDGFKPINDELGHETGDEVLREVAKRMAACVRGGDLVTRIGGDEFAAFLHGSDVYPETVATRMLQAVSQPIVARGHTCQVSASIGIATSDVVPAGIEQLIKCADTAMYDAKRAGGNQYALYVPKS